MSDKGGPVPGHEVIPTVWGRAGNIDVERGEGSWLIDRAGELCRAKGWTLLKSARPGHDMRADVPTIGVQTIEGLDKAGAGCVAVGVGRVILVDKPAVIAAADRAGIAIVGVKG